MFTPGLGLIRPRQGGSPEREQQSKVPSTVCAVSQGAERVRVKKVRFQDRQSRMWRGHFPAESTVLRLVFFRE